MLKYEAEPMQKLATNYENETVCFNSKQATINNNCLYQTYNENVFSSIVTYQSNANSKRSFGLTNLCNQKKKLSNFDLEQDRACVTKVPKISVYFQTSCMHGLELNGLKNRLEKRAALKRGQSREEKNFKNKPSTIEGEQFSTNKTSKFFSVFRKIQSKKSKQPLNNEAAEKKSSMKRQQVSPRHIIEVTKKNTQNNGSRETTRSNSRHRKDKKSLNIMVNDNLPLTSKDLFDYVSPQVATGAGLDFRERWTEKRRPTRKNNEFCQDESVNLKGEGYYVSRKHSATRAHASYQHNRVKPPLYKYNAGAEDHLLSSITDPYSLESRRNRTRLSRRFEFQPNLTRKTEVSLSHGKKNTDSSNNIEFVPSPVARAAVSAERIRYRQNSSGKGICLHTPYGCMQQDLPECPMEYFTTSSLNKLHLASPDIKRKTRKSTQSSPPNNSNFTPFVVQRLSSPNAFPMTPAQNNVSPSVPAAAAVIFPFFPFNAYQLCCCNVNKHFIMEEQHRELQQCNFPTSYQHISQIAEANDEQQTPRLVMNFGKQTIAPAKKNGQNKTKKPVLSNTPNNPSSITTITESFPIFRDNDNLNHKLNSSQEEKTFVATLFTESEQINNTTHQVNNSTSCLRRASTRDQSVCIITPATSNTRSFTRQTSESLSSSLQQKITIFPLTSSTFPEQESNKMNRRYSEMVPKTTTFSSVLNLQINGEEETELASTQNHKLLPSKLARPIDMSLSPTANFGCVQNLEMQFSANFSDTSFLLLNKHKFKETKPEEFLPSINSTQPLKISQNNFVRGGSNQSHFQRKKKLIAQASRKQRLLLMFKTKNQYNEIKMHPNLFNDNYNNCEIQRDAKDNTLLKSRSTPCILDDQFPIFATSESINENNKSPTDDILGAKHLEELKKTKTFDGIRSFNLDADKVKSKNNKVNHSFKYNKQENEENNRRNTLNQEQRCFAELALLQKQKQLEERNELLLLEQKNIECQKKEIQFLNEEKKIINESILSRIMKLAKNERKENKSSKPSSADKNSLTVNSLIDKKKIGLNLANDNNKKQLNLLSNNSEIEKLTDKSIIQKETISRKSTTMDYFKEITNRLFVLLPQTTILKNCLLMESDKSSSELRVNETLSCANTSTIEILHLPSTRSTSGSLTS